MKLYEMKLYEMKLYEMKRQPGKRKIYDESHISMKQEALRRSRYMTAWLTDQLLKILSLPS